MEADRLPAGRVAEAGVGKLKSGAACTRADAGAEAVPGRDTAARWALERLFVRLLPMLERWAHGRLPRHARRRCDTEDLVQDACSGAIRHLSDLDERDPAQVDFYLKQSIRNRIRDEIRRSRIGETTSSEGLAVADPRPSPLDDVARVRRAAALPRGAPRARRRRPAARRRPGRAPPELRRARPRHRPRHAPRRRAARRGGRCSGWRTRSACSSSARHARSPASAVPPRRSERDRRTGGSARAGAKRRGPSLRPGRQETLLAPSARRRESSYAGAFLRFASSARPRRAWRSASRGSPRREATSAST